jgi:hypothetical protein
MKKKSNKKENSKKQKKIYKLLENKTKILIFDILEYCEAAPNDNNIREVVFFLGALLLKNSKK